MADFNRSWADTEEEYTVFLILRAKLGHDDVQSRLRGTVQRTYLNVVVIDEVNVAMTARNSDDLLGLPLHDEGYEEVEEVNVAYDIGLE